LTDKLEFEGTVESFNHDVFIVKVNEHYKVKASLSGKIRQSGIKIAVGDKVRIVVSEYDTSRGRITYRLKS
jgi:translation initiation factor IF-1